MDNLAPLATGRGAARHNLKIGGRFPYSAPDCSRGGVRVVSEPREEGDADGREEGEREQVGEGE